MNQFLSVGVLNVISIETLLMSQLYENIDRYIDIINVDTSEYLWKKIIKIRSS